MAAPAVTYRVKPPTAPMKEGYRSMIAFASNPSILLWEKGVTPFGFDVGDPINVDTMHNGTWSIERPRSLSKATAINMRVAYHPMVYPQIMALRGVEQAITQHFPSGNYVAFFGYLQTFTPDESTIGAQPEATCTINPTMWDPVNGVEADPVVGTGT